MCHRCAGAGGQAWGAGSVRRRRAEAGHRGPGAGRREPGRRRAGAGRRGTGAGGQVWAGVGAGPEAWPAAETLGARGSLTASEEEDSAQTR